MTPPNKNGLSLRRRGVRREGLGWGLKARGAAGLQSVCQTDVDGIVTHTSRYRKMVESIIESEEESCVESGFEKHPKVDDERCLVSCMQGNKNREPREGLGQAKQQVSIHQYDDE